MKPLMRILGIAVAELGIAVSLGAGGVQTELRAHVDTHAIQQIDATTPTRVVFLDRAVTVEVTLAAVALPGAPREAQNFSLPLDGFSERLKWTLTRDGAPFGVNPQLVSRMYDGQVAEAKTVEVLRPGHRVSAKFNLPALPVGEYRLGVEFNGIVSRREWFLVSNGAESPTIEREYARYKVLYRSSTREELKANLKEVGRLDPLDASVWIRLGDLSIKDGAQAEVLGYFAEASRAFDRRAKKFAAEGNTDVVQAIRSQQDSVSKVKQLLQRYYTQPESFMIEVEHEPMKQYILKERRSGKALEVVGGQ